MKIRNRWPGHLQAFWQILRQFLDVTPNYRYGQMKRKQKPSLNDADFSLAQTRSPLKNPKDPWKKSPTDPFAIFKPKKTIDRRFWTTQNLPIDIFWGSEIGKGFVGRRGLFLLSHCFWSWGREISRGRQRKMKERKREGKKKSLSFFSLV